MHKDEEVQAVIARLYLEFDVFAKASGWVNLLAKLLVLFELEAVSDLAQAFVFDVALFEDDWGVLFHLLAALRPLVVAFLLNPDFFDREHLFTFEFNVELVSLSCLLGDDVVELSREVLVRNRKVLGQDDLSDDMLTETALNTSLIVVCQFLVDLLRLLGDNFVKH